MPQELDDTILEEYEKWLIYGGYGTGKTELAATAPGPIYYLVIGPPNELKTLRSPGFKQRHGSKKVILFDYVMEDGMGQRGQVFKPRAFDAAGDKLGEALEARERGTIPPFETIVIENGSTLMKSMMDKSIALGSLGAVSNKAFERMKADNIIQPADNDWNGAQSLMRQFVNWIYHQPYHVVFIAHERITAKTDRKTREELLLSITPNFVGQQRQEIPGLFDNVWRTSVDKDTCLFQVETVGDDVVYCKTRVGGVLREKENGLRLDEVVGWFRDGTTLEERRKKRKEKQG